MIIENAAARDRGIAILNGETGDDDIPSRIDVKDTAGVVATYTEHVRPRTIYRDIVVHD